MKKSNDIIERMKELREETGCSMKEAKLQWMIENEICPEKVADSLIEALKQLPELKDLNDDSKL